MQLGVKLLLIAASVMVSSCALDVKVKEDWNHSLIAPIPLSEAAVVWDEIKSGRMPDPARLSLYNTAVRDSVVQIGANWATGDRPLSSIKTPEGDVELKLVSGAIGQYQSLEQVVPADFVHVKRGFEEETVVEGVGASLVVRQPWSERDSMMPESGLWYPVTAVLNLDQPRQPVLELIDPTRKSDLTFRGKSLPLSVNYTASFARDVYDRQKLFPNTAGLFRFEKYADRMGLHRVSAFDPEKQVCILVHGIYSSPSTWDATLNQFYGNKALRERYEFWTFGYPTGALIPYLAAELRESIDEMQAFRQKNEATNRSVVMVGHSMGGLLSKSTTLRGGDEDWNQLFKVPVDELKVSSEYRETLRRLVYYEPVSGIDKVIFCSTPHRGSKMASKPGGKLIGALVQMPAQLSNAGAEILKSGENILTPLGWEVAKGNLTSLGQLRPNSLLSTGFLNKPLNPAVVYHSVIGREDTHGSGVPLVESSDGVVAYTSSHIEGVKSEAVIENSPHGVHREPDGIQELIRLLLLP